MKLKLKFVLPALLIASNFLLFPGCSKSSEEGQKPEEKEETKTEVTLSSKSVSSIHLETVTAEEKPLTGELVCPAELVTDQDKEALVGSFVQGRVHRVKAKLGDYVRKGEELMLIEGLEVGEIKAGFIKSKAQLEFAEAAYKRSKNLLDQKVGSQKSFLEAQSEYHKALAEFNAEDKKIHSIGLKDEDVETFISANGSDHTSGVISVKSPIDGIVVERNAVIGQQVDQSTNAFRIVNTSTLFADGQLNEKDAMLVSGRTGSEVNISLTSLPEQCCKGKISYIAEVVDEKTRTVKVRASLSNPSRKLKPEMFVEMRIPYSSGAKAIVLPQESVIKDNNEAFVFVAKNDTVFEKRVIEIIPSSAQTDYLQISKGVKAGEKVVSKGAFLLKSELLKDRLGEGE